MKWAILGGFWALSPPKSGPILLKFGPEVEYYETKTFCEQCSKILSLRGKGTYPKFTVLVHF